MTELLAPAGNMEALKAAIGNGCDAVYLGMQKFGARAYSSNFDPESLKEAVEYAHLRGVKIYVTMNTIVFEDEIEDMKKQLHLLNDIGVDGVIVQDLAVFDYAVNHFADMQSPAFHGISGKALIRNYSQKLIVPDDFEPFGNISHGAAPP